MKSWYFFGMSSRIILICVISIILASYFFLVPDGCLPDLGDSILSMFIMRWGVISFPNLPQFWPTEGGVFFQEHLLGQSLIFHIVSLVGVSYSKSYFAVLGVLFVLNFLIPALYALSFNARIFTAILIGVGSSSFPYLLSYCGHPHNWPIFCLIIICFEMLRYAETGNFNFWLIFLSLLLSLFFSMTISYFCILLLIIFILLDKNILSFLITSCIISKRKLFLMLVLIALYVTFFLLYKHFSGNQKHTIESFRDYSVSIYDAIGHALIFSHIDRKISEADKFPILASIMNCIFLIFGRRFLSKKIYFNFLLIIIFFILLSVGPILIKIKSVNIINPIFYLCYLLPGFSGMRVANRFLLAMSCVSLVIGAVVWIRLEEKNRFFRLLGMCIIIFSLFFS